MPARAAELRTPAPPGRRRTRRRAAPLPCAPSCPDSVGDVQVHAVLSLPLRPASQLHTVSALELLPFSPTHPAGLPLWSPPGLAAVLCVLFAAREGLPALAFAGVGSAPPLRKPPPSVLAQEQALAAAERRARDAQLDAEAAGERRRVVESETARLEARPFARAPLVLLSPLLPRRSVRSRMRSMLSVLGCSGLSRSSGPRGWRLQGGRRSRGRRRSQQSRQPSLQLAAPLSWLRRTGSARSRGGVWLRRGCAGG